MGIHNSFTWSSANRYFWWLAGIIAALVLVTVFCSIWCGAGYNDEAWLVLMVQNQANGFWTSFAHYYGFMQNWGLAAMRGGVAVLHGIACAVFVWGMMAYYHPWSERRLLHGIGLWSVVALLPQVFWLGSVVLAPDYKFLAYDCVLAGTGVLFLGLGNSAWLLLSGVLFVQVLFVMPQVGALAPFVFLALALKSWKKTGWFLLGGILGIAFFFLCVSSWQSFQECFLYSGNRLANTHGQGRHGVGMMISGYCKIGLTFCSAIIPSALALFISQQTPGKKGKVFWLLSFLCVTVCFGLGTLRVLSWKSGGCPACSLDIFLILFGASVLPLFLPEKWTRDNACQLVLGLLFLIAPVIFCTGTDKGFENRLTFYIGMLFAGMVIFIYRYRNTRLIWSLNLFLTLALMSGFVYWKQSSNLALLPKTINAQSVGLPADAPVTRPMADHLLAIKQYTDSAKVIINDPCHWYVPWLLKKEMLHLTSFRYYQFDDVAAMIAKKALKASEVLLIESPEYALTDEQLDAIQNVLGGTARERIVLSPEHQIIRFK